jgi:hypothetical protein
LILAGCLLLSASMVASAQRAPGSDSQNEAVIAGNRTSTAVARVTQDANNEAAIARHGQPEPTQTPGPTWTSTPTRTPVPPSSTPTLASTDTPTPEPTPCAMQYGWTAVTTDGGDLIAEQDPDTGGYDAEYQGYDDEGNVLTIWVPLDYFCPDSQDTPTPTDVPSDTPLPTATGTAAPTPPTPAPAPARAAPPPAAAPAPVVAPAAAATPQVEYIYLPADTATLVDTPTPAATPTPKPSPTSLPGALFLNPATGNFDRLREVQPPRPVVTATAIATPQPVQQTQEQPRTVSWTLLLAILGTAAALGVGGYGLYRWRRRHYLAQLEALEGSPDY